MTANEIYFEKLVQATENATLGNLFGKRCGKINKKAIVAFFQDEMVFKIGKEEVNLLLQKYEGSKKWDPSGKDRPMKNWIQVPSKYKAEWEELMKQAVAYYELNNL